VSDLEVRPATIHDAQGIEPLVDDALGLLERFRGGPSLLEGLGVPDGTDAGFAVFARSSEGTDLVGVHVGRAHRRRRIGTALLDAARASVAPGDRFEALALPGDQAVKSLLESAGYKARLLRMSAER